MMRELIPEMWPRALPISEELAIRCPERCRLCGGPIPPIMQPGVCHSCYHLAELMRGNRRLKR